MKLHNELPVYKATYDMLLEISAASGIKKRSAATWRFSDNPHGKDVVFDLAIYDPNKGGNHFQNLGVVLVASRCVKSKCFFMRLANFGQLVYFLYFRNFGKRIDKICNEAT